MTLKEIDRKISELIGDAEVVELISRKYEGDNVLIKQFKIDPYSTNLDSAIYAVKRIADKNNYTFVLTYLPDDGEWKASFGDYNNCSEYYGSNPACCMCISILQFMGKL